MVGGTTMTEIRVEKKEKRAIWPWLLGLAALALLLFLFRRGDNTPDVAATDTATSVVRAAGGDVAAAGASAAGAAAGAEGATAVARFVSWANEGGNNALPQESEDNHPYTSQGIRLMSDALDQAVAGHGAEHAARVTAIRARVEQLQASSANDQHAEYAHAAFTDAAKLMGELGAGNAAQLTRAANAIQPTRPLSPQGTEVRAFFRLAAQSLQTLDAGSANR